MRCQSVALREVVKEANGVKEPVLLPHKPLHNLVEAHFTWCGKGLVEPFLNLGRQPHIAPPHPITNKGTQFLPGLTGTVRGWQRFKAGAPLRS
jgi:hypothetical protein